MNKQILVLIIGIFALFLPSCKSKKEVVTPQGSITLLTPKKVEKELANKAMPPKWVKIMASVDVAQDGQKQGAVADIRLRQDSIVWIELMDNIIGIKAARAFAMADTVAFVNRIEREYFAGSYNYVEKELGTSMPFEYIFQLFQGQLFVPTAKVEVVENQYILGGKDADNNTFTAMIEPFFLDCMHQSLITSTDILEVSYADYRVVNGFRFPHKIHVKILGRKNVEAHIEVRSIETGLAYKVPFNISSKYERIK